MMPAAVEPPVLPAPAASSKKSPLDALHTSLSTEKLGQPTASPAANPKEGTQEPIASSTAPSESRPDVNAPQDDVTDGIRYTPFAHPSSSSQPAVPEPLTNKEQTKYNSVHNIVSAWTTVPVSTKPDAEVEPITDAEQQFLTRECLLRYLRATKWKVSDAILRLQTTLAWRREYDVTSLTDKPEGTEHENETGKQWILGYDNAGRACHYLNPARQNTPRSDKQIRHLVFMLERAIDILPPGQETIVLLINFAESSKGQGASFQQGKQTLYILQNHYPERLGKALLCNLPWHFWAFMKLVTPFIDPQTRNKIVYNEEMRLHVPPEQLRKSHGGDLEFEYDHTRYWPAFVYMAEQRRREQRERWEQGGKRVGEFEAYLKGGQETCLRDTEANLRSPLKVETDSQLRKSVAIQEDEPKGSTDDV